jgi:hypothetical protein
MKARDLSTWGIIAALTATMTLPIGACRNDVDPPSKQPTAAEATDKTQPAADTGLRIVHDEGPMPGPETVLAKGADLAITLADFEATMRRSLLFAPVDENGRRLQTVPAERLAMPHLHITATQNLVAQKIISDEAARLDITVEPRDELLFFSDHPALSRFAPLFEPGAHADALLAELYAMGLSRDDLRQVAREDILARKLEDHLVNAVDEATLWQAYQRSTDTVALLLLAATNTPSSKELDEFLALDAARDEPLIDAHFRQNPERYLSPAAVRMTLLRAQNGVEGPELEEHLKQAERRLSSGEEPAAAASGLGLKLEENVVVLKSENPRAFAAQPGTIGYQTAGPRGAYAWRVEARLDPAPLELTRPLRREIAAELLRHSEVLPSVRERLTRGLAIVEGIPVQADGIPDPEAMANAATELDSLRLSLIYTGHFPRTANGHIPNVGLAETLVPRAFALTREQPYLAAPLLSRERAFVARLVDRNIPSRADFRRDREAFVEAYREQSRSGILQELIVTKQDELAVAYDVRPLRIKYGVLAKD